MPNLTGDYADMVADQMLFFPRIVSQVTLENAIFKALGSSGEGTIVNLPRGIVEVTSTITQFRQIRGGGLRGQGGLGSELVWAGDLDEPMFLVNRCQRVLFEGFTITAKKQNPLLEGIRIQHGPIQNETKRATNLASSLNTLDRVDIRGQGYLGTPIRVYLYDHRNDDKNDHHKFYDCQLSGFRHSAFVLEGRNAKALMLRDIMVTATVGNDQGGDYDVVTVANFCPLTMNVDGTIGTLGDPSINSGNPVYNKGGAFLRSGGQAAGLKKWNWLIGDRNETCCIEHVYVEKAGGLLYVPGPLDGYGTGQSAACPIILDNVQYRLNGNSPADKKIIINHSDMLWIKNCELGERTVGQQWKIEQVSNVSPGTFTFGPNNWIANDGDGVVFTNEAPANSDYTVVNRGYRAGSSGRLGAAV